jgi:hypothetical protein
MTPWEAGWRNESSASGRRAKAGNPSADGGEAKESVDGR